MSVREGASLKIERFEFRFCSKYFFNIVFSGQGLNIKLKSLGSSFIIKIKVFRFKFYIIANVFKFRFYNKFTNVAS